MRLAMTSVRIAGLGSASVLAEPCLGLTAERVIAEFGRKPSEVIPAMLEKRTEAWVRHGGPEQVLEAHQ